jgi:hypothetical protein
LIASGGHLRAPYLLNIAVFGLAIITQGVILKTMEARRRQG